MKSTEDEGGDWVYGLIGLVLMLVLGWILISAFRKIPDLPQPEAPADHSE